MKGMSGIVSYFDLEPLVRAANGKWQAVERKLPTFSNFEAILVDTSKTSFIVFVPESEWIANPSFYLQTAAAQATARPLSCGANKNGMMWVRVSPDWSWSLDCTAENCNVSPTKLDLPSALMHELGHWWRLDHPEMPGCEGTTMVHAPTWGDTTRRTLSTCDIEGVQQLYLQTLTCADGNLCRNTATLFTDRGAFPGTAYCESFNERASMELRLRAYAALGNYPGSYTTLAVIPASGGPGIMQRYVTSIAGSHALYEWAEIDSGGGETLSGPFAAGTKPSGWDDRYSITTVDVDAEYPPQVLTPQFATQSAHPNVSQVYCADIIVYATADSLAVPVYNQIYADTRDLNLKVRRIVGADALAQTCRDSIATAVQANRDRNAYAGNQRYPVNPGPEVYIVGEPYVTNWGATKGVATAAFPDTSGSCGTANCRSDYWIYDLNGDSKPDGPISRVPALNVTEAQRAAGNAGAFNLGTLVDNGKHVTLLSGALTTPISDQMISEVKAEYEAFGYIPRPVLSKRNFALDDRPGRLAAFQSQINAGVREVFGLGGYTGTDGWPGDFVSCDVTGLTRSQRTIAWLPGCEIAATWKWHRSPCVIGENLLFRNTGTAMAAVVGHLDAGFDHRHIDMASYLARARRTAAASSSPVSVARVAFNAVLAAMADKPSLHQHALSTSVWGSYTRVTPPASGGGGCPIVDTWTGGQWVVENSILARSASGVLERDSYMLKAVPDEVDGRYRLRIREDEQEQTTLAEVKLVSVDHRPGIRMFAIDGELVPGTLIPAQAVTTQRGDDVTLPGTSRGDEYLVLQPGDTLLVQLSGGPSQVSKAAPPAVVMSEGEPFVMEAGGKEIPEEIRGNLDLLSAGATDDRILAETGLILQVPDASVGWRTAAKVYPRAEFGEIVVDSLGGTVRLIAVGSHRIRSLGRVVRESGGAVTVNELTPTRAVHSRLGNVNRATWGERIPVSLVPGDTLALEFTSIPTPDGRTRSFFVVSRGVYSAFDSHREVSPIHPMETQAFHFALGTARPNPTRGELTISFSLAKDSHARLAVYDVAGRLVRTLVNSMTPAGIHEAVWDGRNSAGSAVGSGVFFYRLEAGEWHSERKVIVLQK